MAPNGRNHLYVVTIQHVPRGEDVDVFALFNMAADDAGERAKLADPLAD